MENLIKSMQISMNLLQDEKTEIFLGNLSNKIDEDPFSNTLIAKVLAYKKISFGGFKGFVTEGLPHDGHITITPVAYEMFKLEFELQQDMEIMLHGGPWNYDHQLVIFETISSCATLASLQFRFANYTVTILDLPQYALQPEHKNFIATQIGDKLGGFVSLDNSHQALDGTICIKVRLDISKPLLRGFVFRDYRGSISWASCKYARLPHFCFRCGLIGHSENFCSLTRTSQANRPYGIWLRAENNVLPKFQKAIQQLCTPGRHFLFNDPISRLPAIRRANASTMEVDTQERSLKNTMMSALHQPGHVSSTHAIPPANQTDNPSPINGLSNSEFALFNSPTTMQLSGCRIPATLPETTTSRMTSMVGPSIIPLEVDPDLQRQPISESTLSNSQEVYTSLGEHPVGIPHLTLADGPKPQRQHVSVPSMLFSTPSPPCLLGTFQSRQEHQMENQLAIPVGHLGSELFVSPKPILSLKATTVPTKLAPQQGVPRILHETEATFNQTQKEGDHSNTNATMMRSLLLGKRKANVTNQQGKDREVMGYITHSLQNIDQQEGQLIGKTQKQKQGRHFVNWKRVKKKCIVLCDIEQGKVPDTPACAMNRNSSTTTTVFTSSGEPDSFILLNQSGRRGVSQFCGKTSG